MFYYRRLSAAIHNRSKDEDARLTSRSIFLIPVSPVCSFSQHELHERFNFGNSKYGGRDILCE